MHQPAQCRVMGHVRFDRRIQGVSDVVMQVAIAQMAEGVMTNTGEMNLQQRISVGDKIHDPGNRHRDVVLHVTAGSLLRLAHVFSQQPQCFALREAFGDQCIGQQVLFKRFAEHCFKGFAGVALAMVI
ncbi:hypothetical protein D3C84_949430 [compost metagenome]